MIKIELANEKNFNKNSLDSFDRFQEVTRIYRLSKGRMHIVKDHFTDDWSRKRKREKASDILSDRFITYCAFDNGRVVGELMLVPELDDNRMIVDSFHVTRDMRHQGIGRALFNAASEAAIKKGARALYVSANSAVESIDFYLAMGCIPSLNPIKSYAEDEPCDIQMECELHG